MRNTSILVAVIGCGVSFTATAQSDFSAPASGSNSRSTASVDPRAETIARLHKKITLELTESRLEDVFLFIADATGARLEPIWLDDRSADGLDPDSLVSISVTDATMLSLIERILDRSTDGFTQATWQMSKDGALQIGPKSQLNTDATLRVYDVADLLFVVPSFQEVPDLDLGSIVQGGGGSTQTEVEIEEAQNAKTLQERADELEAILVSNVEPDEWVQNGGDGATIRFFNSSFLIRAPEYIHRQIAGADYWPSDRLVRRFGGDTTP